MARRGGGRPLRPAPVTSRNRAPFQRFPTWMWRNTDVDAFIDWMRDHNASTPRERARRVLRTRHLQHGGSIASVLEYLDKVDPHAAAVARERYGCLTPRQREPSTYGRAVLTEGYRKCEEAVVEQLRDLLRGRLRYEEENPDSFLDAAQNARLVASAERYYRIMYYGDADLWNLRDTHMFETLEHVLDARGAVPRLSSGRTTPISVTPGRPRWGLCEASSTLGNCAASGSARESVALIGMGTHQGTVAAADDWDGDMKVKRVNPSRADRVERLFHDAGVDRCLARLVA